VNVSARIVAVVGGAGAMGRAVVYDLARQQVAVRLIETDGARARAVARRYGGGRATVVEGTLDLPNGVEFSPDESKCYIEDSGPNPRPIYAYDVVDDGTRLVNKRVLIAAEPNGTPDGFRVDMDGNLWCGWGMGNAELDGVKVFNPEGQPIGFIALPERCANLAFGGRKRNRLFMTASHSLYSLYVNARGAKNA